MSTFLVLCLAAIVAVGSCSGGWSNVPNDDQDALRIAKFAESELNARSNTMYKSVVSLVQSAQKQVVAGYKWRVSFDFSGTDCFKSVQDTSNCNVQGVEDCTVVVWEQPWLNSIQLLDFKCQPKSAMAAPPVKKEPTGCIPGGTCPINVDDAKLLEAVDFAWRTFEAQDTCMYRSGVSHVTKASRQVVAGWKYFITMGVGYSRCSKNYVPVNENECQLQDDVQDPACLNQECEVVVWDQPWRTPRYVMLSDLKCVRKQ